MNIKSETAIGVPISALGEKVSHGFRALGAFIAFLADVFKWIFKRPYRIDLLVKQMEFIGVKSTAIISLTAFFTGAVFALQTGKLYGLFNMESMVGATVGLSLTREIGPVFAALMVTARACSAMAAEIGTMRVTEQIDALESMGVNAIHYLAVPRVIASSIMVPLLTMLYNFVGVVGSYIVGIYLLQIQEGPFIQKLYYYVDQDDIWGGLVKAAVFGFLISSISCFTGLHAKDGAKGVGKSTTAAVVTSAVVMLVTDYFLTTWILEYLTFK